MQQEQPIPRIAPEVLDFYIVGSDLTCPQMLVGSAALYVNADTLANDNTERMAILLKERLTRECVDDASRSKPQIFVTCSGDNPTRFDWRHALKETNPDLLEAIERSLVEAPQMPLFNLEWFYELEGYTWKRLREEFGFDETWVFVHPPTPKYSKICDGYKMKNTNPNKPTKYAMNAPTGNYLDFLIKEKLENESQSSESIMKELMKQFAVFLKRHGQIKKQEEEETPDVDAVESEAVV